MYYNRDVKYYVLSYIIIIIIIIIMHSLIFLYTVSGVAVAAYWWWPRKKSTQTQTRTPMSGAKYKELIDKCEKVVEALKMNINEWQGNLSRNKELA